MHWGMLLPWKCTFEPLFALTFCKKCAILYWEKPSLFPLTRDWKSLVKQGKKYRFPAITFGFVFRLTVTVQLGLTYCDQKAIEVLLRLNGFFDGTARRRTPPPYAKRMAAKVAQKNLRVDADLERKREFRVPPLRPIFVACETCVQAASKVANCCFVGAACCRACSAEFRVPPLRPIFVAGEGD